MDSSMHQGRRPVGKHGIYLWMFSKRMLSPVAMINLCPWLIDGMCVVLLMAIKFN
jgi:hypothetical protein